MTPTKFPTKSPTDSPSVFMCNAKRIKLEATTQAPIQMFELQSFSGGSNIALGGNASQSSTFNNNNNFAASKAIDGSNSTLSHTSTSDLNAWWEVELQAQSAISRVVILNRFCGTP
jgi:hypothetical protein